MTKKLIRLGHSPDPDDAFMFYGLACGAVDSGEFEFEHILRDIQTLNDWARDGQLEVTAISVCAYPYVQDKYAILAAGASMGATELVKYVSDVPDSYAPPAAARTGAHGPMVVARPGVCLEQLPDKKIAVPGTLTSAFLELNLAIGKFEYEVMMFDEIIEAVGSGRADAGLIIHEGQLTYKQAGLDCLLDLGQWWYDLTALPLPLGCNTISRNLGADDMKRVSGILKASIEYGLKNRSAAVKYALEFGRGLDLDLADRFVGMYVNQWTLDYGPLGRKAVIELLKRGADANLVPAVERIEFI